MSSGPELPRSVLEWTQADVRTWCEATLAAYFPDHRFGDLLTALERKHAINGCLLVDLTGTEWQEAIPSIGARKVLKKAMRERLAGPPDPAPSARAAVGDAPPAGSPCHRAHHVTRVAPLDRDTDRPHGAAECARPFSGSDRPSSDWWTDMTAGTWIGSRMPSGASQGSRDASARSLRAGLAPATHRKLRFAAPLDSLDGGDEADDSSAVSVAPGAFRNADTEDTPAPAQANSPSVSSHTLAELTDMGSGTAATDPQSNAPDAPATADSLRRAPTDLAQYEFPDPSPRGTVPPVLRRLATLSFRRVRFDALQDDGLSRGNSEADSVGRARTVPKQSSFASALRSRKNAMGHRQSTMIGSGGSGKWADAGAIHFAAGTASEVAARLMAVSNFSQLPIVDCHYDADWGGAAPCARLWYAAVHGWCLLTYFARCLARLLNAWHFAWCALCGVAVVLCAKWGAAASFPPGLWTNVLLFPLAFAVNAAYQRREGALSHSAEFKARCLALYLSHRCWHFDETVPPDFLRCSCEAFGALFESVRGYLTAKSEEQKVQQLRLVYDALSELSLVNDVLRISGVAPPLIAALTATLAQVVSSFERLRMFSDYRTPSGIRVFIHVGLLLVPLLLVPLFAHLASEHSPAVVYGAGFLLPLPFLILLSVQKGLENPFAAEGADNPDGIQLNNLQMVQYMADAELLDGLERMKAGRNEPASPRASQETVSALSVPSLDGTGIQ